MKALILTTLIWVSVQPCAASILGHEALKIDFTKESEASGKATWSENEIIRVNKKGLGWDGEETSSRDGWIQTEPLALGMSWRAPYSANVSVTIDTALPELKLKDGQTYTPHGGDVFVRYSVDRRHWSSWQVLKQQRRGDAPSTKLVFTGSVQVPKIDRVEYTDLQRAYSQLDVPWKSDEEAVVKWILERQPDFFAKHTPFIGYVKFRYEGSFYGNQRVCSLKATADYGMSGLHSVPNDPNVYADRDGTPWRFRAE